MRHGIICRVNPVLRCEKAFFLTGFGAGMRARLESTMAPATFRVLQGRARDADTDAALVEALRGGEPGPSWRPGTGSRRASIRRCAACWFRGPIGRICCRRSSSGSTGGSARCASQRGAWLPDRHLHPRRAREIARRRRKRWLSLTPTGDSPSVVSSPIWKGARRSPVTTSCSRSNGKDRRFRVADDRRDDAGRSGGRARRVGVDGAAAHQPRQQARSRCWCAAIRCWRVSPTARHRRNGVSREPE